MYRRALFVISLTAMGRRAAVIIALTAACLIAGVFSSQDALGAGVPKTYIVDTAAVDTAGAMNGCDFPNTTVDCSLVGAIKDANGHPNSSFGTDYITFDIEVGGVGGLRTIRPGADLPAITDPVIIDATTQPVTNTGDCFGTMGNPCIEIYGGDIGAGSVGLTIQSNAVTVTGLAFTGLTTSIQVKSGANIAIKRNFVGTINGTSSSGGAIGIEVDSSASNVMIGGTTANERNLISGNSTGIGVDGQNTVVEGNYIGTTKDGTGSIPNHDGLYVLGSGETIGGTAAGAGNLISGNQNNGNGSGIHIVGQDIIVAGNLIGTRADGNGALPNDTGILVFQGSGTIGGSGPESRNVISGNTKGLTINVSSVAVLENYIGLNAGGTAKVPNVEFGIQIGDTSGTSIGAVGSGNVISGNGGPGIWLQGRGAPNAPGLPIEGNYIGTNPAGSAPLGNTGAGILLEPSANSFANNNTIANNVIAGNTVDGVSVGQNSSANALTGNYIGTNANHDPGLGNGANGISIVEASGNTVGGQGVGNVIMNNFAIGIQVDSPEAVDNLISENSIDNNGQKGIYSTDGGNGGKAAPVLATATAGSTHVTGGLQSTPNTQFKIEFFRSPVCDASGSGEGRKFIGSTTVMTVGDGNATIDVSLSAQTPGGEVVTATATDPQNNTSDFSNCITMVVPTPTPTPSPTPSPTHSPSPTPTKSPTHTPTATPSSAINGDADCDGVVTVTDALDTLSESEQVDPGADCADRIDVDCDQDVDGNDALRILLFVAGTPMTPASGCGQVGDAIT